MNNQSNTNNVQTTDLSQNCPMPTGIPTGPLYTPFPPATSPVSPLGTQPTMPFGTQPAMPMPQSGMQMPAGESPFPMDMSSPMMPRIPMDMSPMTPRMQPRPGMVAPLPGSFPSGEQSPLTTMSPLFTPGFLRTQIGKMVRVEFLIGTSGLNDRIGTLIGVGTSYILLQEVQTDDILLCDIYSIKFVRFYR